MTTRRDLLKLAQQWEERGDLLMTASDCARELREALNPDPNTLPAVCQRGTVTFDDFWRVYPRRDARRDAEKAWRQVGPDDELAAAIIRHVEGRAQCDAQWAKGRQFIPLPATFLRGERWNDEYERITEQRASSSSGGPGRVRSERELAAQRALAAVRRAQ